MSLLQEVIQLMNKNGCDNKSLEDLVNRSEEELAMIKYAYINTLPKEKKPGYPEPKTKAGYQYNLPHTIK